MRRLIALLAAASFVAALSAQTMPPSTDGVPSVTDPSVPLNYVGNDGSVSLGINREGQTEGQLLGVFARNNERALVGQLWWDRTGAGGLQSDYNWLWGMTAQEARERPDAAMVARLSFAMDQNADHDRKATVGFGVERRDFSIEGYLAHGISSARTAGSALHSDATTVSGSDAIGNFDQIETTTVETLFSSKPYGGELGLQVSHVFEPLAMRVHGGASVQDGDGASANTVSIGLDTPLGTRGWGLSALGEHVSKHGGLDPGTDDRLSVFLRYEFGGHGSFVAAGASEDPAWVARSLGRPSSAHPRVVESYRVQRSQTVGVTRGPKQYTNRFPLLHDDSASTAADQTVTIAVLANDSDPDNDPLALTAVTQPAHGTATIAGTQIIYTPSAGFSGSDSFRYTASDGRSGSGSALVTVTVAGRPNQAPVARNDTANAAFGQPATIAVLANDTDPDGDAISITGVGTAQHGTVVLSGTQVTYTPEPGFSGNDLFTYTISDGRGGTSTATVSVVIAPRVNRLPVARDDAANAGFGAPTTVAVLGNDIDPDGDALSLVSITAPAHGSAVVSGSSVIYTPAAGYAGIDIFLYTISDGRGGTASASVTVTVAAQPNRPPVAVNDTATTAFGQPVSIAVLANDSDPDGDPLAITSVTVPPGGGTAVITGGNVLYTPAPIANGAQPPPLTYTISDGRGGTATATVTVTVSAAPNQPPVAVDDVATTLFGQPVTIAVLSNDSDPDGDSLTITAVTAPVGGGTAVISGASVIFTPGAFGATSTDRFTYTISDGRGGVATATVTVTIGAAPNQPPVAVDDTANTAFGQPVQIAVLANDSDPDGDVLSIAAVNAPLTGVAVISGTVVTYTPDAGFSGIDRFAYAISDGRGGTATAFVAVVVAPVPNQPPVAVADVVTTPSATPVTIAVLANDSDPDGDTLTVINVTSPTQGTAVISGNTIIYTPNAGALNLDQFEYTISDGHGNTATAAVGVFVLG
ncbi:MAG: Ig-like domain-containing protein [Dokdonella sp.]|uniref:Ig-like domain-containing protein n=1 Tax=Dokdonella sp. TaxID=2291710 RepID=UPI0032666EFD